MSTRLSKDISTQFDPTTHLPYVLHAMNLCQRYLLKQEAPELKRTPTEVANNWHNSLVCHLRMNLPEITSLPETNLNNENRGNSDSLSTIDLSFSFQLRELIRAASSNNDWLTLLNFLSNLLEVTETARR